MIERAADARLAALAGNPRLSDDLRQRIQRGLRDRVADARVQVQAYISTSVIGPPGSPHGAWHAGRRTVVRAGALPPGARPLAPGAHAEVVLTAAGLRLTGRVDLLRVSEAGAHITDYKTGSESPMPSEQLDLYALLWDLDRDANPSGLPVASLTAAYPGRDVAIPVPGEPALREIEKQIAASIDAADAELASDRAPRRPSAENCGSCDVRHLCDDYWSDVAPRPVRPCRTRPGSTARAWSAHAHGPHSWWLHPDGDPASKLLIQAPQSGPELLLRRPRPDPRAAYRRRPRLQDNRGADERGHRGIPHDRPLSPGPLAPSAATPARPCSRRQAESLKSQPPCSRASLSRPNRFSGSA